MFHFAILAILVLVASSAITYAYCQYDNRKMPINNYRHQIRKTQKIVNTLDSLVA